MDIILYILSGVLCYWFASIVHELGHLVIGFVNNWDINLLIVGPLGIKKSNSGRHNIYWEKNTSYWGGDLFNTSSY